MAFRRQMEMEKKAEQDMVVIEEKRAEHRVVYEQKLKERLQKGIRRGRLRDPQYRRPKEAQDKDGPKGDVDGSVEAIVEVLDTYHSDKCRLSLVDFGVGSPTENDLGMAQEFKSVIYCFNVPVSTVMEEMAKAKGIVVKHFNIIYRLVADLKEELNSRLPYIQKEEILGECLSMKNQKENVSSATTMEEVGIIVEDKSVRFEPDDDVVCYEYVDVPQTIDWNPPGF